MTDAQMANRIKVRNTLIAAFVLLLVSIGLFYFWFKTKPVWERYQSEKAQEVTLQSDIDALVQETNDMRTIIEQSGIELISFTEDRTKYINLASSLSTKYGVHISKLTVSDVWSEGQMSVITTDIELEGELSNINKFLTEYCGGQNINRLRAISLRPKDRYPWFTRTIDGVQVLSWFNLDSEEENYKNYIASLKGDDPEKEEATAEQKNIDYITLNDMFSDKTMKAYYTIDFLGRS